MSRFGNLEFGSASEASQKQGTLATDEQYFLSEAQEAFENGRFEHALRAYAKVLEFNPKSAVAWIGQVRSLLELGETTEARLWVEKALASFPNEPELLAAKAVALARLGDLQGALSFSDAAVESQTNTPYIWLARGDVLLARKEKRAEYCFEKALALAGQNWLILWLTARVQAYYKHFAKALKFALEALALQPGRSIVWLEAGKCQMQLGLVTQAQNSFEQARELDPNCSAQQYLNENAASGLFEKLAGYCRHWFHK
ncbi:MAG TPA: tetratricopeptide repeat protein [Verrucomicrobiae bacterium]|nr:tetratricopeptide repeat protein [Verrucomicrobiae bacterium]